MASRAIRIEATHVEKSPCEGDEDEVSGRAGELHEPLDQMQVSLSGMPDSLFEEEPPVVAEGGSDRYLDPLGLRDQGRPQGQRQSENAVT
jgi:hypothetical protein